MRQAKGLVSRFVSAVPSVWNAKGGWCFEGIQLDLEAKGLIARIASKRAAAASTMTARSETLA
jgi:hypothetical protein